MSTDSYDEDKKETGQEGLELTSASSLPLLYEESDRGGSYDAFTSYLRELRRIPRLSPEEERELAVKFFEDKDIQSAYRLVQSNLWIVVKIAREYAKAARNFMDLVQEGNIGLMEAVKNFDPYKGTRLPSYAVWWIRAFIIRYLIANWRMVKIGTTQAQRKLFFNLYKEKERLEREGFRAEPKLLAEKLQVKESEVVEMQQRLGSGDLSVDAPLGADSDQTLHAVLASESQSLEDALASKELRQLMNKAITDFSETLRAKEKEIFKQRLLAEEKATLQDLSAELGISRERVRQIEEKLKTKFKTFLSEELDPGLMMDLQDMVKE